MSELQVELLKLPVKIKKTHKGFGLLPGESMQFWQDLAHESTGMALGAFDSRLPSWACEVAGHAVQNKGAEPRDSANW
jgi:hypothetical protein